MAAFELARHDRPAGPGRSQRGLEPGNVAEGAPSGVARPGSSYSTFESPGPCSARAGAGTGYDRRASRSSTSASAGTPPMAPALVQLTAAAALANHSCRSRDQPLTMP